MKYKYKEIKIHLSTSCFSGGLTSYKFISLQGKSLLCTGPTPKF